MTIPTPREYARLTADVVLRAPDPAGGGELVLLIERAGEPYAGYDALPGGHVDPGETTAAAAVRELAEETGIDLDPAALTYVGTYAEPGRDPRGRYVTGAYTAVLPAPIPPTAGSVAAGARWVPVLDALCGAYLAFDHRAIVADAVRAVPPAAARRASTLIVGWAGTGKTVETVARTRAHLDGGGLVWLAGPPLPAGGIDHRRLDWHEREPDGVRVLIEVACRLADGRLRLDPAAGPLLLAVDPWPTGVAGARLTWLAEHGPGGATPVSVLATALRLPPAAHVWTTRIELPATLPLP